MLRIEYFYEQIVSKSYWILVKARKSSSIILLCIYYEKIQIIFYSHLQATLENVLIYQPRVRLRDLHYFITVVQIFLFKWITSINFLMKQKNWGLLEIDFIYSDHITKSHLLQKRGRKRVKVFQPGFLKPSALKTIMLLDRSYIIKQKKNSLPLILVA